MKAIEKIMTIVLACSIVISAYSMGNKISIEQNNKNVEVSVTVKEVEMLAQITEKTPEEILKKLKSSGLTSLSIEETTLRDLANLGRVLILNGWQILDHQRFLGIDKEILKNIVSNEDFKPNSYYVFTKDQDVYDKIKVIIPARGFEINTYETGDVFAIQEIKGIGGFSVLGLGFDKYYLDMAKNLGLNTVVMARELLGKTNEEIKLLIDTIKDRRISVFIPQNNQMPKETEVRSALEGFLKENEIFLGFDEFIDSGNLITTAKKLGYSTIRVYNRPPHKWMEEYLLAVRDRNDRLLYLHLFLSGHEDMLTYNAEQISEISKDLAVQGFKNAFYPSNVKPFKPIKENYFMAIVAAFGVLWALWRLLKISGVCDKGKNAIILASGLLFGILAPLNFCIFRDLTGLATAVLFPVVGIYGEMKKQKQEGENFRQVFIYAFWSFLRATFITLMGVLLLAGIYSNSDYMLGLAKFRGIKALYILSYAIIIMLYLKDKNTGFSLKKPILSFGDILYLTIFAGILFVLINRTGNYSVIPIPKWEISFRIWLEKVLWVRPRTKEFLLGFPALIIAGGLSNMRQNRWSNIFYMAALLGEVSMINTFSHFHISTFISIIRSLEGVFLGLVLGTVTLGGLYLYEKKEKKFNV